MTEEATRGFGVLGVTPAPTLDLLAELKQLMISVALAVCSAMLIRAPMSEFAAYVDSPRLREEIDMRLDQILKTTVDVDQLRSGLLETQVDVDQLRSGRGHPPSKSTLIRPALSQAMWECGIAEDLIIRVYDHFQAIYEPASLGTQRVRRARAKKAMSEPVAKLKLNPTKLEPE